MPKLKKTIIPLVALVFLAAIASVGFAYRSHHLHWPGYRPSLASFVPWFLADKAAANTTDETVPDSLPRTYADLWSAASPFRTTVAQHKARGATVVSHAFMDALWDQGIAHNGTAGGIPIYIASPKDPLLTVACTMYGGNCNAKGLRIHLPDYAVAQQSSDGHITVIDRGAPKGSVELDCWQATIVGTQLLCSWAGVYVIGGDGVSQNGSEGIHGGMAVTTVFTTGAEIANGRIDHALGLNTHCLNNPSVYPADMKNGTDASCDGSSNPPHYGNLLHLLWTPARIDGSAYSVPCKVILRALATYGAYLDDTGNDGLELHVQDESSYTADPRKPHNPWPQIQSVLNAAGDGNGKNWASCLDRLQGSDFELIEIPQPTR